MMKQYKVLVVDDNPDVVEITRDELLASGYEVITASNGLEGLRKAEREHPDLVILDIMLPGLDGYEVCHRLRSKSRTSDLLILMYSAKVREADREMGLKVGANEYLTKSLDSAPDLVRRVDILLAERASKEAESKAAAEAASQAENEESLAGAEKRDIMPATESEPEVLAESKPESVPAPEPEPEAASEPAPEPTPEPAPEPEPVSVSEGQTESGSDKPLEPESDVKDEDDMEGRQRSRLSPKPRL